MALQLFVQPWLIFQFLDILHRLRTPWTGDEPVRRPLHTHRKTQRQNKCTQTFIPRTGFEPTIPVFERAKVVHALDCEETLIGASGSTNCILGLFHYGELAYLTLKSET
jgi:hypothetical protein